MRQRPSTAATDPSDDRAEFAALVETASAGDSQFATQFVSRLLRLARDAGASDVHLDPTAAALELRWRLDGVLHVLGRLPREVGPNVVARLKVLAGLLTYELALPQEGRIRDDELRVEARLSTFPTLHGERAVVRMLRAGDGSLETLAQLGLPADVLGQLEKNLSATSGAILVVGPAGSGKTTTAYACLRHVVSASGGGRSIASLEDPVEVALDGVAQSQVRQNAGDASAGLMNFDMAAGLRSLLRLDPEVILIGEMRDRATAEIALQAALTGQLVVTTFHAGHVADAVNRLVEMGIAAYAVRNAVRLVVAQRLVRRLCTCAEAADVDQHARSVGLAVGRCWLPAACDACRGTGYRGRSLVAECRTVAGGDFDAAARDRAEGMPPGAPAALLWSSAESLVEAGVTSPLEVVRVLGFRV
jgi:type II secretory ATPase GspE/PulE/Tfp pilus assembly ATPase PilB-like protein